jgi:hypothetical protein
LAAQDRRNSIPLMPQSAPILHTDVSGGVIMRIARHDGVCSRTFAALPLLTAALMLSACSYMTQTTSGRDWLAAYPAARTADAKAGDIDAEVRQVAAVEPTLRFPARIGLVRIGQAAPYSFAAEIEPPTADEAKMWNEVAGRLGGGYGEFVPVSPLIAAMLMPNEQPASRETGTRRTIEEIRLAAARQHLDAVLVYEVDGTADAAGNPLSLAEWTLIGAFVLPTENVKAVGVAQAMLIDVRNGYPYGTVQASADDKQISTRIGQRETESKLREAVMDSAVEKLGGETEAMLRKLKPELAALDVKPRR